MLKIAVRVSLMRPQEGSGGLRPLPGTLDGAGRGGGAPLTPSCPPPANSPNSPRRRVGGRWRSTPPRAVTSPGLSCGNRPPWWRAPMGSGDQNDNFTKMKEAARQPVQRLEGQRPKSGVAPLVPQHSWAAAAAPRLTLSVSHGPARPEALAIPAEPGLLLARGIQASGALRRHLARRRWLA